MNIVHSVLHDTIIMHNEGSDNMQCREGCTKGFAYIYAVSYFSIV